MCWTAAASLALGATGLGTAAVLHKRGESYGFTIPLAYFSLMELLQFASYSSIDLCALSTNTLLTLLSYIHIAFQPIFINMFLMYLLPTRVRKRTQVLAYAAASIVTILLLIKLVPFVPESLCTIGQTLCGPTMCTVSGTWHLAWSVPTYTWPLAGDPFIYYAVGAFLVPLFYGAWMGVLRTIVTGPILAYALTGGNPLEWAAVWCLFSVGMVLSLLIYKLSQNKKKPFKQLLR